MKKSDFPHSKKFKLLRKTEVYSTNCDFFFFFKFVICVRISHCYCSPWASKIYLRHCTRDTLVNNVWKFLMCTTKDHLFLYRTHLIFSKARFTFLIWRSLLHHSAAKLFVPEYDTRSNVYWTVHHCNSWRMKDQLDVTCYFISLLMRSTCFGH